MKTNKGISLIVLIITIIVMIILAGAIILSLNNAGIINKANEAVEKTNLNQVQTLAQLKWTEAYLNNRREVYQLKQAVMEGLENENIDTEQYKIKVTANGVTVSLKENITIVSEEKSGKDGLFKYVMLSNGEIQITRYIGPRNEGQKVTIPATYVGENNIEYNVYAVGNIDADANHSNKLFNIFGETNSTSNDKIASIEISKGIKEIKELAFSGCTSLTGNLLIPEGVTTIGRAAFSNCTNLDGILTLPNTLETIGAFAFNRCEKLGGDIKIPEGIVSISRAAFQYCYKLNSLKLPSTLTAIENNAFYACKSLTGDLVIPEGVTTIGKWAFYNCNNLKGTLTLPTTLKTIENFAFYLCSGLTGDIKIPEGITTIPHSAFYRCSSFDGTLTLPTTLETINANAFYGCSSLTGDLVIPEGVKTIGETAFYNCSGLTGTITTSGMTVATDAFDGCTNLTVQ